MSTVVSQQIGAEKVMTCQLVAVCIEANHPVRLARFWAGVLGWEGADAPRDGIALLPSDDTGFRIRFVGTQEQRPARTTCTSI